MDEPWEYDMNVKYTKRWNMLCFVSSKRAKIQGKKKSLRILRATILLYEKKSKAMLDMGLRVKLGGARGWKPYGRGNHTVSVS